MLRILLSCLALILVPSLLMAQFVRIADEAEFPLPDNWYLTTDTLSFPVQLVYENELAEILLFESQLAVEDIITNQDELRGSVDLVIEDAIGALPEGKLQTSTGFYDGYRAGFVLEFASTDSATSTLIQHRLKGIIYRHPEGYQLLFTIWGKCAQADYGELREAMEFVQDGFFYRGEYEEDIFGERPMSYWPIVLLGLALVGLMLFRPRKSKTPAGSNHPNRNE